MNESEKLKNKISSVFRLYGFVLKSETRNFLVNQLLPLDSKEREKWLDLLIENIQNQKSSSACIEQKHIEKAIEEINEVVSEDDQIFTVLNAFDIPHHTYNDQKRKLELQEKPLRLLSEANMKSKYLRERYNILHQKTIRHELFSSSSIDDSDNKNFKLLYVENLLSTSKIDEVVIIGLLTQPYERKFYLEDTTGIVQLDLTNTKYHSGFFCDGCFVLVEGKYEDNVIKVTHLGFPPAETSKKSREIFDLKSSEKFLKISPNLLNIEKSNQEATIVFLSDVRLDVPAVMENLRLLFLGYNDYPPVAIILMGSFSKPYENNMKKIKNLFQNLGEITNNCDRLRRETELVLVPSLEDIGSPNILPKPSISNVLVEGLKQKWNRIRLATNPCRLRYCTQQIVVCRADLISKFCRNTIHFPENGNIKNHFAQTLICQNHLVPFNLNTLPVYWNYDSALWLYPLPDLVVIGDQSSSFDTTQQGCTILNTGSFFRSNFSFKVYIPSTRTIEDSKITA